MSEPAFTLDVLGQRILPPSGRSCRSSSASHKTAFPDYHGGLAEARGVSRQTLYNRFGNKEALFHWAVDALSGHLERAALAALERPGEELADQLLGHYCAWFEPMVTLLNQGPYGQALFGLGMEGKSGPRAMTP